MQLPAEEDKAKKNSNGEFYLKRFLSFPLFPNTLHVVGFFFLATTATPGGQFSFLTILYWLWMACPLNTNNLKWSKKTTNNFFQNKLYLQRKTFLSIFFLQTFVCFFIICLLAVVAALFRHHTRHFSFDIDFGIFFCMIYFPFVDNLLN